MKHLFSLGFLTIVSLAGCSTTTSNAIKPIAESNPQCPFTALVPDGKIQSPDGNYLLFCQKEPDENDCCTYDVFLQKNHQNPIKICDFQRTADASWSPNGEWICFNFHDASNTSTVKIFSVAGNQFVADVRELLERGAEDTPWLSFADGDKLYLDAIRWKNAETVSIAAAGWYGMSVEYAKQHGYSDVAANFNAKLEYSIQNGVKILEVTWKLGADESSQGR